MCHHEGKREKRKGRAVSVSQRKGREESRGREKGKAKYKVINIQILGREGIGRDGSREIEEEEYKG